MEKKPVYSYECMEEIMKPEYTKFRDLCRELSFEARRLDLNKTLMFCGVAWDFEEAFKEKMMRAFK